MTVVTTVPTTLPDSFANTPTPVGLTWAACNTTGGGNRFLGTGREVILLRNTGATPRLCTVTAITGSNATKTVAAGEYAVMPFVSKVGRWRSTAGYVTFTGAHAELEFAILRRRK